MTAVMLAAMVATAAQAWNASCDSGEVCIFRDRDFAGPVAATSADVQVYSGQYPGSTANINDSVSSVKNRFTAKDVLFHNEYYYGGAVFCVDSYYSYSWVGLLNNDAWSSHNVTGDDSSCN